MYLRHASYTCCHLTLALILLSSQRFYSRFVVSGASFEMQELTKVQVLLDYVTT